MFAGVPGLRLSASSGRTSLLVETAGTAVTGERAGGGTSEPEGPCVGEASVGSTRGGIGAAALAAVVAADSGAGADVDPGGSTGADEAMGVAAGKGSGPERRRTRSCSKVVAVADKESPSVATVAGRGPESCRVPT